jgi:hypothetical protein
MVLVVATTMASVSRVVVQLFGPDLHDRVLRCSFTVILRLVLRVLAAHFLVEERNG